uniref:Uncharacterized protein n=1 Tax=Oryza rufipogon TaxID=4529 RepID=A0A0E0QPS0_ORYRU
MIKQRRRPEGKGDQAEEEPTESLTRLHYCLQAGSTLHATVHYSEFPSCVQLPGFILPLHILSPFFNR